MKSALEGANEASLSQAAGAMVRKSMNDAVACVAIPSASIAKVSEVRFYKNGVDQGAAYSGIPPGMYFPAFSLFGAARVRANFGPHWIFPPSGIRTASRAAPAASSDADEGDARDAQPMSDLEPLTPASAVGEQQQYVLGRRLPRAH